MFYPSSQGSHLLVGSRMFPSLRLFLHKLAIAELYSVFPPETLDSDFSRVQWPQQLCCHAVIWLL